MTIERILCPVDFSDPSRHAAEYAVALAGWLKASITGLHVHRPVFAPVAGLEPPAERIPDSELARLRAATAACFADAGARNVNVVIEVGVPARRIVESVAALHADLIVLGTHGASGFEHLLLGSVAEKVLRTAACPVLTVPPQAPAASSAVPFRRIVCAVDFSASSLAGLKLACVLAREADGVLTLVHVIEWPWLEPPPPVFDELPEPQAAALSAFRRSTERSAADRLHAISADLRVGGGAVCRVVHGKAHVEITRLAGETNADLIVVGLHGRNPADLMLLGSTTNQIVRRASCAVLTVRH